MLIGFKKQVSRQVILCYLATTLISPLLSLTALAEPAPIQEFSLATGQQVFIQENHNQPIVTIDTWIQTGSVNEIEANNGVSHFLEHLLFKGTVEHPAGEFEKILESKGGSFNAATSDDFTHYHITIASKFFKDALKLHADMLQNATFPVEELDKERLVVQEEINRATDNPMHKLFQTLSETVYQKHGYAWDTLGPKSNIAKIPRDDIHHYYHYWYQPEHMKTVVVGDVDTNEVIDAMGELFPAKDTLADVGSYQAPTVDQVPTLSEKSTPKVKVVTDPKVTQPYYILAFPGPSIEKRDDIYPLDVAFMALGQGASSRLNQHLREEKQLVQSISSGNMTQKYAGMLYVYFQTTPENQVKALEASIDELNTLKHGGVTGDELAKIKTQMVKDFIFQNESTEGVTNGVGYNVSIGNLKDYTGYVANIQKVTQEEIKASLCQYVDYSKATLIAMLPQDGPLKHPTLSAELETMLNKQANTCLVNRNLQPVVSAQIKKETLGNGMTFIATPNPNVDTVALKIFIPGGVEMEPLPGVASLTARLLSEGTKSRTQQQLSEALEAQGMQLSFGASEDAFEISAASVADDLGELLLLLQDTLTQSLLTEEALTKEKSLLQKALVTARENPSSLVMENLKQGLYPMHPYGNVGKRVEKHLSLIKRDHIVEYASTWLQPKNMVVSAVGNFNPVELKNNLNALFPDSLNKPTAADAPKPFTTVVPLIETPKVVDEQKPEQAAVWVAQGWLTPPLMVDGKVNPDHAPLKVLHSLLGTGMSSRLFVNLREKQGLAYAVGSAYPSHRLNSNMYLFIGTDPKNKEAVLKGFQTEIEDLQNNLVDEVSLQAAKDKLVGLFALGHESPAEQAYFLGFYEAIGLGYQYDIDYPLMVQQVTAQDIQRVAKTWFGKPSVLSIIEPLVNTSVTPPTSPASK